VEAAGDGGTTLTGADGPYNDEAFRAKANPISESFAMRRAPVVPFRFHRIERFELSIKRIGRRECARLSKAGLFSIRNGARGREGVRVKD
jgi:hypothetical protein